MPTPNPPLIGQPRWHVPVGRRPCANHPATAANRAAWETLTHADLPFLVAFSDGDPITAGMAPILRRAMPGAQGLEHPVVEGAGHFLQEDAGDRLGAIVASFVAR